MTGDPSLPLHLPPAVPDNTDNRITFWGKPLPLIYLTIIGDDVLTFTIILLISNYFIAYGYLKFKLSLYIHVAKSYPFYKDIIQMNSVLLILLCYRGPLRRNYQFLINRVIHPTQGQISPIKPVKDNLNR